MRNTVQYILKQLLYMAPMALVTTSLIYDGLEPTPGDTIPHMIPSDQLANVNPEQLEALREFHSLNDPFLLRYVRWLGGLFHGNFGYSITSGVPIKDILSQLSPATLELSLVVLAIPLVLGSTLGIPSALKEGSIGDNVLTVLGMIGVSIPQLFFGMLYILIFALGWAILLTGGHMVPGETGIWNHFKYPILPVSVLGASLTVGAMRYSRFSMLDIMNKDYIETARAKGLSEWRVNLVHGSRVALIPVAVLIGFRLSALVGGSVVIETIFQWPGIGNVFKTAVTRQNYPLAMMIVLFSILAVLMASFLVDTLTAALDPRVKLEQGGNDMNVEPINTRKRTRLDRKFDRLRDTEEVGKLGKNKTSCAVCKMLENRLAVIGLVVLAIILISCLLAPLISPYDSLTTDLRVTTQPPSPQHLLSMSKLGRDVFSRTLYDGRLSILIGLSSALGVAVIGVLLGRYGGYKGGLFDKTMLCLSEISVSLPQLILVTMLGTISGRGLWDLIFILILIGWGGVYRRTRVKVLSLRKEEHVRSMRAFGLSDFAIAYKHMLPNAIGPVVVNPTLSTAMFIPDETTINFLRLGVSPEIATWDNILNAVQDLYVMQNYQWLWLPVEIVVSLFVASINRIGDGLRDSTDPIQQG